MKRSLTWAAGIGVPALVVAGALTVPAIANASVDLPSKTAAEIVALASKSAGTPLTGTVRQTSDLGLPDLSALGGAGSSGSDDASSLLSELTGTHTAKIFVGGDDQARVQTLDQLAERDVIRDGDDVWAYDSAEKKAVHVTLPADDDAGLGTATGSPTAVPTDPTQVATEVLDRIGEYTTVTTASNVRIAGQKAYQITLTPKNDDTTLVGSVSLAVDSSTGVPLRAEITAAGASSPAFSVAFTSIRYDKPAASTFDFTPPKGTTVKTIDASSKGASSGGGHLVHPGAVGGRTDSAIGGSSSRDAGVAASEAKPTVSGSGWSTVLGFTPGGATGDASFGWGASGGSTRSDGDDTSDPAGLLDQVTTAVDGGRILQTSLVSMLLTDDGHVYVGAVKPEALEAAAGL